jgi:FixJ family two-component response regulator
LFAIAEPFSELSDHEQQVVTLVGDGLSNKEIVNKLGVTEGTIKCHLHSQLCRNFVPFSEALANSRHDEPPDKALKE